MSLWGNSDGVALTGTVAINQNAVAMTGSSTAFTTEVDIGDLLLIDDFLAKNPVLEIPLQHHS